MDEVAKGVLMDVMYAGTAEKPVYIDGRRLVHKLSVQINALGKTNELFPDAPRYASYYRLLKRHDKIRLLDGFYQVTETSPFTLRRLEKELWPDGAVVTPGALTFEIYYHPDRSKFAELYEYAMGGLHEVGVGIGIDYGPALGDTSGKKEAFIVQAWEMFPPVKEPNRWGRHKVEVGGVPRVGPHAHRVRSIVLPNPERGIRGYLEIDPKPLAPDEEKK